MSLFGISWFEAIAATLAVIAHTAGCCFVAELVHRRSAAKATSVAAAAPAHPPVGSHANPSVDTPSVAPLGEAIEAEDARVAVGAS